MKIKIKKVNAVAHWRWNLSNGKPNNSNPETNEKNEEDQEEEEEEEELCGICRSAFEGCCPDCKIPGDDCPLIWGECSHIFHMHCLLKWISEESSKQACPMDRRPWVTAGGPTSRPSGNLTNNTTTILEPITPGS